MRIVSYSLRPDFRWSSSERDGQERNRGCLDDAREAVDAQRAANVVRVGGGASASHPVVLDGLAPVNARAREAETERTGHRGLGPAGIRRAMAGRVAAGGVEGAAPACAGQQGGGSGDPERGEARGREVHEVVEPGGGPAERAVALGLVPDHAVGGIDGLVERRARQAGYDEPEDGRDNAVGKVLGEAFDGRAADGVRLEGGRVATDDLGNRVAGPVERAGLKRIRHGADVVVQAALGDEGACGKAEEDERDGLREDAVGKEDEREAGHCRRAEAESERRDAGLTAMREGMLGLVPGPVAPCYQSADPTDGMADRTEQPARIAADGFDREADKGKRGVHGHSHSRRDGPGGASMRPGRPEPVPHGGDLDAARARFPDAPGPWIDLSTGINPEPYPLPELPPEAWSQLPQWSDEWRLAQAAARRYGADRPESVVCAPGTQAIIQMLPRLVPRRQVAVLGPTYGEHAAAWRRVGHDVREVSDLALAGDAEVVVVVNPDNPTGRIVVPDALHEVARRLADARGLLVVDEAFADVGPREMSVAPDLPPATVVLRSLGKMYGLAGLRLGFAIAHEDIAHRLRDALGPWAVSGPALAIGAAALADDDWLDAAIASLGRAAQRLDGVLGACGSTVLGGTSLFRLAAHREAPRIAEALGRHGILVRRFPHQPTWLRFGLPGAEAAWQRLERALAAACDAERVTASS